MTRDEAQVKLKEAAEADPWFLTRLLEEPKATTLEHTGYEMTDEEVSGFTEYMSKVVPYHVPGQGPAEKELSDDELSRISGGGIWW